MPELGGMQRKVPLRKTSAWLCAGFVLTPAIPGSAATPERVEEVARRGAEVMPFNLEQTRHIFTKTATGGLQQVVVRDTSNRAQVDLIRKHLSKIAAEFARGDFSDPARIHGESMPGLAVLRSAKPGQLLVVYREQPNGAEVEYRADDSALIAAVHEWFDAQVADHGPHAVPGHRHGDMDKNR
jgi:hypothetical protein